MNKLTNSDLKKILKERGCKGYSNLPKQLLLELLHTCPQDNCIEYKKKLCKKKE